MHKDGSGSLWHLFTDPEENEDVAGDDSHASALQEYRLLLIRHVIRTQRRLPRTWPY